MSSIIESTKNNRIKFVKSLEQKKNRWKEQKFTIEGIRAIKQLLENTNHVREIFYSDKLNENFQGTEVIDLAIEKEVTINKVSEDVFNYITDTESPQYILAIVDFTLYNLEEVLSDGRKLILLDRIQDPGNLGTILRTAEAMGFNGVVIIKGTTDIYSSKVLRSTMGAHIPVVYYDSPEEALEKIKECGIKVISTSLEAEQMPYEVDLSDNIAIVIGNEARGISAEIENGSDELIKIPMIGKAESLNAAVASSMIMYESLRQKLKY